MANIGDLGGGNLPRPGNVSIERPGFQGGVDISLAGTVTGRDLFIHVVVRWFAAGFLTSFVTAPIGVLVLVAQYAGNDLTYGSSIVASSFAGPVICFGIPILVAFASLFLPVRIANSQYSQLIDECAPAAESAYGHIYRALTQRETPVDKVVPRRMSPGLGLPVSNYLQISKRKMEMWVVVMASGRDLWVGWTGWVRHVPIVMPFTFIMQSVNRVIIRGSDFHEALRMDEVRAVQAAVHSAVIDGVNATLAGEVTTVVQAFGHDIPVEASRASAPPVPVPVPVPTPQPFGSPGAPGAPQHGGTFGPPPSSAPTAVRLPDPPVQLTDPVPSTSPTSPAPPPPPDPSTRRG